MITGIIKDVLFIPDIGINLLSTTVILDRTTRQMYPLHLWPAAVHYTIYTRDTNRILRGGFTSTQYNHWYGKKPYVSHLRVFGTRVFVHIPETDRRKLDPKAIEGLFIG